MLARHGLKLGITQGNQKLYSDKGSAFSFIRGLLSMALTFYSCLNFAQTNQMNLMQGVVLPESNSVHGNLSATINANNEKIGSTDRVFNTDYSAQMFYFLKNGIGTDYTVTATKDLLGERRYTFMNSTFGLNSPFARLGNTANARIRIQGAIPMDTERRKQDSLRTQITVTPNLIFLLDNFGFEGVTFRYAPYFRQNFHRYSVNTEGRSNTQRTIGQRGTLGFAITDNLSLAGEFFYQRNFTYRGNTTDSYGHDESINYNFGQNLSFSLGHTNDGSALALDGQTSNLEFSNIRNSIFYFNTTLSF